MLEICIGICDFAGPLLRQVKNVIQHEKSHKVAQVLLLKNKNEYNVFLIKKIVFHKLPSLWYNLIRYKTFVARAIMTKNRKQQVFT